MVAISTDVFHDIFTYIHTYVGGSKEGTTED